MNKVKKKERANTIAIMKNTMLGLISMRYVREKLKIKGAKISAEPSNAPVAERILPFNWKNKKSGMISKRVTEKKFASEAINTCSLGMTLLKEVNERWVKPWLHNHP